MNSDTEYLDDSEEDEVVDKNVSEEDKETLENILKVIDGLESIKNNVVYSLENHDIKNIRNFLTNVSSLVSNCYEDNHIPSPLPIYISCENVDDFDSRKVITNNLVKEIESMKEELNEIKRKLHKNSN